MIKIIFKSILFASVLLFSSSLCFAGWSIDGEFSGWNGETVVKLNDGSYWIQSQYVYHYCYSYSPKVELFNNNGQIIMKVAGCGDVNIPVTQLSNVRESKIDGDFEGFDQNKVFTLRDGSVWRQKKYQYWYRYAYSPSCIVYYNNGWKLSVLGKTIDVEKIR